MRTAAIALTLALGGCSFIFEAETMGAIDAGTSDACVAPTFDRQYPEVPANAYFIGGAFADDNNDGLSPDTGFRSFTKAQEFLIPGATLVVQDGIHTDALNLTVSGTEEDPITIMAAADGRATIDGQGSRVPCKIYGASYVNLLGLHCTNSNAGSLVISNDSANIIVRSVTATKAEASSSTILLYNVADVLIEDVAASGSNSAQFQISNGSNVRVRRFFALSSSTNNQSYAFQSGGCNNCLFENLIIRGTLESDTGGVLISRADWNTLADNTQLLASFIYGFDQWALVTSSTKRTVDRNSIKHLAIADTDRGIFLRTGSNFLIENTNFINLPSANLSINENSVDAGVIKDPGFSISVDLRDSIILGGDKAITVGSATHIGAITSNFNDILVGAVDAVDAGPYSGPVPVTGENNVSIAPDFDTTTYGYGAYLMQSEALHGLGSDGGNLGAEVLYRYKNGLPTTVPLWPWPMEDRIVRDLDGYQVTLLDSIDPKSGLWATLDGIYPACQ